MQTSKALLKLAILGAVAVAGVTPRVAQAQSANRGQIVQAVAKLNAAQLAFARRYADDAAYAQQFDAATAGGNYDAAASLVSSATGVPKGSIKVHPNGGLSGGVLDDAASTNTSSGTVMVRYASAVRNASAVETTGTVCFDFLVVRGCFKW